MVLLIPLLFIWSHGLSQVEYYTDQEFLQMVDIKVFEFLRMGTRFR